MTLCVDECLMMAICQCPLQGMFYAGSTVDCNQASIQQVCGKLIKSYIAMAIKLTTLVLLWPKRRIDITTRETVNITNNIPWLCMSQNHQQQLQHLLNLKFSAKYPCMTS